MSEVDALRARGDHRVDPVRFRLIEALARRSAAHEGEARRRLDARLSQLLADYAAEVARRAANASSAPAAFAEATPLQVGPLAALGAHLAQQAALRGDGRTAPEGQTLTWFRSVWTRLSAERRLTQSLARVPTNAGPLNSHNLVHQSLALMRDLSPEYLHRFMSYVDTLFWLDEAVVPRQGRDRK